MAKNFKVLTRFGNNNVLYGPPIYFELGNQEHNGNLHGRLHPGDALSTYGNVLQ